MAEIRKFLLYRHLRSEPNEYILHHVNGELRREGPGLSFWFSPLKAAVSQVPVEDCETTFLLRERTSDFQESSVQITLTYRFDEPVKAAKRVNFSVSPKTGAWTEQPLERLASFWAQKAQGTARTYLASVSLREAATSGADVIRDSLMEALRSDAEIEAMGVAVVDLQVIRVAPSPDLEKAMQAPTREAIQQKADEAGFARRANAVEKERVIKENELATQIKLAQQEEQLIEQRGKNHLLQIEREADAEKRRTEANIERQALLADAYAKKALVEAEADAEANRKRRLVELELEGQRIGLYEGAPNKVIFGFAMQTLAEKLSTIQHLNLTPDLLTETFGQFLRDEGSSTAKSRKK